MKLKPLIFGYILPTILLLTSVSSYVADFHLPFRSIFTLFVALYGIAVLIFWWRNVYKCKSLQSNEKFMWCLLIWAVGTIAIPLYWYKYVAPQNTGNVKS